MDEKIRLIELANILWDRARVAALFHDDAEAERLREDYRERLREILSI